MTLVNLISAGVLVAIVVCAVLLVRHLRRKIDDADGLGDLNTNGAGTEDVEGISLGELGESADDAEDDAAGASTWV